MTDAAALIRKAAATRALILAETRAGVSVNFAARTTSRQERAAGVRFGDIAAAHDTTTRELTAIIDRLYPDLAAAWGRALALAGAGADAADVLEVLGRVVVSPTPALAAVLQSLAGEATRVYEKAWSKGVGLAAGEVRAQRLRARPPVGKPGPVAAGAAGALVAYTLTRTAGHLLATLRDPRTTTAPPALVEDTITRMDRAGAVDTAQQGVYATVGAGRGAVWEAHPIDEMFSSELLDGHTCDACSSVDGREYTDVDRALADYPGWGGYRACRGGARCRGVLVAVGED